MVISGCAIAPVGCAPPGVNAVPLGNFVICWQTEVIMPSQAVVSTIAAVGDAE